MAMIAVAVVAVGVGIYAATRTVSVPGQKLGEIAAQTAKEGEPRLIVWGTVRPIGGNLVAVQEPPRIERRKHKSGGKGGGGGSSTTTEHPHRTYAIGICEGPITGIRRVWRNNKLVYDGRPGSTWGAKNNGVFLRKARFFLGGYDQMPSADLEKIFGVGNVPAMRGTAYMVMADEDLSDMGGAVPQWLFEVVRAEGFYLTSRPYAIEVVDESKNSVTKIKQAPDLLFNDETIVSSFSIVGGEHRATLFEYKNWPQEATEQFFTVVGGVHNAVLVQYKEWPTEETIQAFSISGGRLHKVIVLYSNWPQEATEQSFTIVGGIHGN